MSNKNGLNNRHNKLWTDKLTQSCDFCVPLLFRLYTKKILTLTDSQWTQSM